MTVVSFIALTILHCLVLYLKLSCIRSISSYLTFTLQIRSLYFFPPVLVTFKEDVTRAYHLPEDEVSTAEVKSFIPTESKDTIFWSSAKRGSGTNSYGMCWLADLLFSSRSGASGCTQGLKITEGNVLPLLYDIRK